MWTTTNNGNVQVTLTGAVDSAIFYQSVVLPSDSFINLSFDLSRALSSGSRFDTFQLIGLSGADILKVVDLVDLVNDGSFDSEKTILVTESIDSIGFRVRNLSGSGTATYIVRLFDIAGVESTAFYSIMGMSINDRMNQHDLVISETSLVGSDLGGFSDGFSNGFNI